MHALHQCWHTPFLLEPSTSTWFYLSTSRKPHTHTFSTPREASLTVLSQGYTELPSVKSYHKSQLLMLQMFHRLTPRKRKIPIWAVPSVTNAGSGAVTTTMTLHTSAVGKANSLSYQGRMGYFLRLNPLWIMKYHSKERIKENYDAMEQLSPCATTIEPTL